MPSLVTLARDLLQSIGYPTEYVRSDVPAFTGMRTQTHDMVAFAHNSGPFDSSTATILVSLADTPAAITIERRNSLGQEAIALGTPAIIVVQPHGWTLLAVDTSGPHQLRELDWQSDPGELRNILAPRALLEAKLGTRQLALFPAAVSVSIRGREMRQDALRPLVDGALRSATEVLTEEALAEDDRDAHTRAARIVIGALTAAVLRDKDSTNRTELSGSDVVLSRAMVAHPQQFSWLTTVSPTERDLVEGIIDSFEGLDFTTVEPMLLSELYESRLMDDAVRKKLGTHYTPIGLARRLLSWLPIESVDPDNRVFYDPTCGSGSLLIAAHDRLRDLQPRHLSPAQAHADLVTRIRGGDTDPVAVSIANLALFLNALPAGNGWQVDEVDFMSADPVDPKPSIIISNPPWEYSNTEKQDDQAQRMLDRLVDQLPSQGLLGVILPAGWLTRRSTSARSGRRRLFSELEIFELWRLPDGTFSRAGLGAAVLLARKPSARSAVSLPVVQRRVSDRTQLPAFYESGDNRCFLSWTVDPDDLGMGPLRSWYQNSRRDLDPTLKSYSIAVVGPQPESPKRQPAKEQPPPNTRMVNWALVRAFSDAHNAPARPLNFPFDMQSGSRRGELLMGNRKILVSGVKNPERPWRLKVAIDPTGDLLVRNTVTALIIKEDRSSELQSASAEVSDEELLLGLFAFLGTGFVSAWLDEASTTRYMSTQNLLNIPAPDIATLRRLANFGRILLEEPSPAHTLLSLESAVWEWLDAPARVVEATIDRLNEADAPEGRRRYPSRERQDERRRRPHRIRDDNLSHGIGPLSRAGTVLDVEGQLVRLQAPGLTGPSGETTVLPPRLPGALLRKGTPVVAIDDGGRLEDLRYVYDETMYLSSEQVDQKLSLLIR